MSVGPRWSSIPHIVESVVAFTSPEATTTIRCVSSTWRDACHAAVSDAFEPGEGEVDVHSVSLLQRYLARAGLLRGQTPDQHRGSWRASLVAFVECPGRKSFAVDLKGLFARHGDVLAGFCTVPAMRQGLAILTELNVAGTGVTPETLIAIISQSAQLRQICLARTNASADVTRAVATHSLSLTALDLSYSREDAYDASALLRVIQDCKQLTSLNLESLPISLQTLSDLAEYPLPLVELHLGAALQAFPAGMLKAVVHAHQDTLQTLHLDHAGVLDGRDAGLNDMLATVPGLTSLSLSLLRFGMSNDVLAAIGAHLSKLRYLSLVNLTPHSSSAPTLCLALSGVPLLTSLDVSMCPCLTDDAVLIVAEKCPALEVFRARDRYGRMTDASLVALARGCQRLVEFDVSADRDGPTAFTSVTVLAVAENAPGLARLGVAAGAEGAVSEEAVSQVVLRGRQAEVHVNEALTSLECGPGLTDAVVEQICRFCPRFRSLRAQRGHALTDVSLRRLAARLPELEVLEVWGDSGYTGITAKVAAEVIEGLPLLCAVRMPNAVQHHRVVDQALQRCPCLPPPLSAATRKPAKPTGVG